MLATLAILILLSALWLSGCGGASSASLSPQPAPSQSTPPANISVTLSPGSTQTLDQTQTLNVTAAVANDGKNAGVQWSVTGPGSLTAQTSTSTTYAAPTTLSASATATVTATSVTDPAKAASVQITVNPAPAVTTTSVPAATLGMSYSATITAAGGTSPFTWALTSGSLPAGLSLNSSTSNSVTISGTPTLVSSPSATLQVTDATHTSASQTLSFLVNAPPVHLVTSTLRAGVISVAYSQTLQATSSLQVSP